MRLLIIGTLDGQVGAASQIALSRGAKVNHVDTIEAGLEFLRSGRGADLVLADVKEDLVTLITSLESERIAVPVIACGVGNDTQAAVRAIKAGAKEYIPLPPDAELIGAVLTAVAEENSDFIHTDARMTDIIKLADQVAPSDASILITGPSGTGKEMMARYLHIKSKRRTGPFIAVNCAAIPENLLESELFGHEKGAFTGAIARRIGKFEEANGGTILLDEISEMDPRLQAKLLRVLQEREIDRVGSNKPVKVNVRILATSNRNLEKYVASGGFREDLYFRLNVVNLCLPPLRERPDDIIALARHFAAKYSEANGIKARGLSEPAIEKLLGYEWPGNVRELENAMHRSILLASGDDIGPDAILLSNSAMAPASPTHPGGASAREHTDTQVGKTVSEVERELIIDTLSHCLGNRTHAATILGISIRTLRNKLKQYNDDGFSVPSAGRSDADQPPL
ncbi:sigma-54-dependent transcriptional regulator [Magnetovibrio blakemorei]|uniref:Sigma-54-dependent Fis family transcriptional regulator n=1 Tax=Magnetovibrio blakemorei TaxID=28181 RepID=A0A1E5Q9T5_9PROT|nr:sigma-54 dependent transcriptional regulator [Magnetovibrio blakemorei]OEJ68283.1 sigma-54-dependent Fis family transcriptional regulator [Magnetovibrio blakemorei]